MFTVKFMRHHAGSNEIVSICCPHYVVDAPDSNRLVCITTYPSMLDEGGVSRHLSDDMSPSKVSGSTTVLGKRLGYDVAYVENSSGITIATFRKPEARAVGRAFSDNEIVDRGVSSN